MLGSNRAAFLVFSVSIVLAAKEVASAPTLRVTVPRSESSETQHTAPVPEPFPANANRHGHQNLNPVSSYEDSARQNFESPKPGRTMQRSDSQEHYPSPHGKDARWRFDLRHTVEADISKGFRGSLKTIQASSKAAVLRGTILRAHMM